MEDRFRKKLAQQFTFIENSCAAYDRGQRDEAIRIGTSVRVLLHDSGQSVSLLSHLQAKDVALLSTCTLREPIPQGTFFDGLVGMTVSSSGLSFHPKFASADDFEMPSDQWWEQSVIGLGNGRNLSRRVIALAAVNKDGGAHVDEVLPKEYSTLCDGVWEYFKGKGTSSVVPDHHLIYLRQMGFEIMNSPKLWALI